MAHLNVYAGLYLENLRGRGLSVSYVKTARTLLKIFERFWKDRDITRITTADLYDYVLWLRSPAYGKRLKPRTVEHYSSVVAIMTHWMFRHDFLTVDPSDGFTVRKHKRDDTRRVPTQDEMTLILDSVTSFRERALLELMYACGLRIQEALHVEVADVKLDERVLLVRFGKGKKDRYVPFSHTAKAWLVRYLSSYRKRVAKGLTDEHRKYLFVFNRNGKGRLSWKMVNVRWKNILAGLGLGEKGYTLHSIRHACATHLLENGSDVRYVQELLGHESLKTTQRYTRLSRERIKAMYRTYHPRENELYEEVTGEYRSEVEKLKMDLLAHREVHRLRRLKRAQG